MEGMGGARGGEEIDGRGKKKKMGRLRELNKAKQTPERGRRAICLFKGAALEYRDR
jgi:hypothetical protein